MKRKIELLAPAGNLKSLAAAVDAGADSVYFGLGGLNARRGAENINPENLREAVERAHSGNAKAYLALNIDIAPRETGLAARYLEFAAGNSVDAVIIKDPALFLLIPFFPEMKFHLSTQAAISSSAGVRAARDFGISRVILPRELDFAEIKAASSVPGIETEIFAQGAMCFCISGRCLLSSWLGGRSGNRGLCASPCRFLWRTASSEGRFLSAFDICLADRIGKIRESGVCALKIEGRLKSPEWIARAVKIYRRALDGMDQVPDPCELEALRKYAGREMSPALFDGLRAGITGEAGRPKTSEAQDGRETIREESAGQSYDLSVRADGGQIRCSISCGGSDAEFAVPLRPSGPKGKAKEISSEEIRSHFMKLCVGGIVPGAISICPEDISIRKGELDRISGEVSVFLRRMTRKEDRYLRIGLREAAAKMLEEIKTQGNAENSRSLGERPGSARVSGLAAVRELRSKFPRMGIIAENLDSRDLANLDGRDDGLVISISPAIYEQDLEEAGKIIDICVEKGLRVEVNSWDGWLLAQERNARMEGGPGLMILNPAAGEFMRRRKFLSATVSIEADKDKISEICASSPLPLSLVVSGRPALMLTRIIPCKKLLEEGACFSEKKGLSFFFRRERGCFSLRPEKPFDIGSGGRCGIKVRDLIADLTAEKDPCKALAVAGSGSCGKFNFDGKLK